MFPNKNYGINGRVTDINNTPYPGITVRIYDASPALNALAANGSIAITDVDGKYNFSFTADDYQQAFVKSDEGELYVAFYNGAQLLHTVSCLVSPNALTVLDVKLNARITSEDTTAFTVAGLVRNEFGDLMNGVTVEAFDRDLRKEESLGRTTTVNGQFSIQYKKGQFIQADKSSADLVVKVYHTNGHLIHTTPIQFNAPKQLDLTINLGDTAYRGMSAWESSTAILTPLLDGLSPLELREDTQYQDISFLAGETGMPSLVVVTWTAAQLLSDAATRAGYYIDAAVFFGCLRQGHPGMITETLLLDMLDPQKSDVIKNRLLKDFSNIGTEERVSVLEEAIKQNLMPARIKPDFEKIGAALEQLKLIYAAAETGGGGGKGTIGDLIKLTPAIAEEQSTFMIAFTKNTGTLDDLWKELQTTSAFDEKDIISVKLSFEFGTLTRNHVPLVAALKGKILNGEVLNKKEFAKYDTNQWVQLLKSNGPDGKLIGYPANMDGETEDEKYLQYATVLEKSFERTYPTASFASKFKKSVQLKKSLARTIVAPDNTSLADDAQIDVFLEDNPSFFLDNHRIDAFIAETPDALRNIQNPATTVTALKTVQRTFKLSPTFNTVDAMINNNITSAQQVYFMGNEQFAATMEEAGINTIESKKTYQRAENAYAMALSLFGAYSASMNGIMPSAIPSPVEQKLTSPAHITLTEAMAAVAAVPNLQSLFGSQDYCECKACRSVYSAAAYFVDINRFLNERNASGLAKVWDVLNYRRPDLGQMELSCENTNTVLPYIDLVNEILEDAVLASPGYVLNNMTIAQGVISPVLRNAMTVVRLPISEKAEVSLPDSKNMWTIRDRYNSYRAYTSGTSVIVTVTKQTHLTQDELLVSPEYTNNQTYTKLAAEIFPFNLPFNLWFTQSRAYLQQIGISQPEFLRLFQQKTVANNVETYQPSDNAIFLSALGMTELEGKIITGTLTGKNPWDFWGLKETGNSLPNPATPSDTTTDITGTWITVLSRVPVLLNRTGLQYKELLQLLHLPYINPTGSLYVNDTPDPANTANCDVNSFTVIGLTAEAATRMHRFVRLWKRIGGKMYELDMALPYADINTPQSGKVLDEAVLQNLSRIVDIKQRFGLEWPVVLALYNNIDNTNYTDYSQSETATVQTLYQQLFRNKRVAAIGTLPELPANITGIVTNYVPVIIAATGLQELELQDILSDLAQSTASPLTIALLSGIYRYSVLAEILSLSIRDLLRLKQLWGNNPFASPASTLAFIEMTEKVKGNAFSISEVNYLLAHQPTLSEGVGLDDKTILLNAQQLRDGLAKITDNFSINQEETTESYIKSKLGMLPALKKDSDLVKALAIINETWVGSATESRETLIENYFSGVLDTADAKNKLKPAPAGLQGNARFDWFQPQLQAYIIKMQHSAFVRQKMAETLGIDAVLTTALLEKLQLQDPQITNTLINYLIDTRLLQKTSAGNFNLEINEANFPALYRSMRLLHKIALIVSKLKLKPEELDWWLTESNTAAMGWPHPSAFPVNTLAPLAINKWTNLVDHFTWRSHLSKSSITITEWLNMLNNPSASDPGIVTGLATLTGWNYMNIIACVNAFGWLPRTAFKTAGNLLRLTRCMEVIRKFGVSASRVVSWAKPQLSAEETESLKQALKARYDWPQWQEIIKPLQDNFRLLKRNALLSWLINNPDKTKKQYWTDANGVYNYFLIDVEMSSKMLTSRLKQAIASTQLFVQRCFLNLESDVTVNESLDSKWGQWQWMKYYRVWEANRKVFLYPENWLEPELREEKSPFFLELENELMQTEITTASASAAFANYVEKVDTVGNLEIRAMYSEVVDGQTILHVFGRTRSTATPSYYYRRRYNNGRWTPWSKVETDINGDHLLVGVFNQRLYLMWPQFIEKAETPDAQSIPNQGGNSLISKPNKYYEISLCWSEFRDGKWTPKEITATNMIVPFEQLGDGNKENIQFRTRISTVMDARIYSTNGSYAPRGVQSFRKTGRQFTREGNPAEHLLCAPLSGFKNNMIQHFYQYCNFYNVSVTEFTLDPGTIAGVATSSFRVLNNALPNAFSVIDSKAAAFNNAGNYFFWDTQRSYFVDYTGSNWANYEYDHWVYYQDASFKFYPNYHPFSGFFSRQVNTKGVDGLLNRRIQVTPQYVAGCPQAFNFASYQPSSYVKPSYRKTDGTMALPTEDVDFTYAGSYAPYNWELFFHAPFYIGNKLAANQRFEEALEWYHYIFNPTSTDAYLTDPGTPQQKYWITKPFFETTKADYYKSRIDSLLTAIAKGDATSIEQVKQWRDNPFNPHLIAGIRTVAYQKNVLLKYIQTIISWADQLFRQNTSESINEAAQLYVLADTVLGAKPQSVPKNSGTPVKTFNQLTKNGMDAFGNALVQVENILPGIPTGGGGIIKQPALPRLDILYFGIPNNEKLVELWNTVSDRLFKIRHSMNIDGVEQQLPLFDPQIDPAALVKAAAGGLSIGSVLADINAPLPLYRFNFMIQRALELCGEVKMLGNTLLSALEKKDAEAFSLLRSTQEISLLANIRGIKNKHIDEAKRTYESLQETKKIVQERINYYTGLLERGLNDGEKMARKMSVASAAIDTAITTGFTLSAGMKLIPAFLAGVSGFGGSPTVNATIGGEQVGGSAELAVNALRSIANSLDKQANLALSGAGYERRTDDWKFQKNLALKELPQIDKQILVAEIRQEIADIELKTHDRQADNLSKELEYMQSKFTNRELYDWLSSQLTTVYFQCYQHAFDLAKRAEKCFRYELGLSTSNYIQYGYWDSLKKGLLSGENLYQDIKRMESAYYEQNRRTYELTKHVSLAAFDPVALLQLKTNGECFVDIPESVFDLDYPGHYFRRIKSVSLSIPCIAGPHTTIACTLTLAGNKLRKDASLTNDGKYARNYNIEDPRFRDEITGIQSIATSNAQFDSGLFQLNFGDERYLPFEGAGAVSSWHIKLNNEFRQFDFDSISDVLIHLSYTAREGGGALSATANSELRQQLNTQALAAEKQGLFKVFNIKQEFSSEWYQFLHPAANGEQILRLNRLTDRLPFFTRSYATKKASQIGIVARVKNNTQIYSVHLSAPNTVEANVLNIESNESYGGLHAATKSLGTGSEITLSDWQLRIKQKDAANFSSLEADAITDLFLIINYSIS